MMKKRSREILAPDITPLIDVVFLLLIFFMVSTVFKKEELALLLSLPQTQEGESVSAQVEQLTIELSEEELAFNGRTLSLIELEEELKTITDKTRPVDIRIDKSVRYEKIVEVLDKLKLYELTNLSLITEK